MERAAMVVVTRTPMLIAISISMSVVPAARRRRGPRSVDIVLKSIPRDEGANLPLPREIGRGPGDVHRHPFQIAAIEGRNGWAVDGDRAGINRGAGHFAVREIGRLKGG